jgi:hypothetical protein
LLTSFFAIKIIKESKHSKNNKIKIIRKEKEEKKNSRKITVKKDSF